MLGELESSDGDGLASDAFSIDEDALIGDDVDNGGKFAFEWAVVDSGNSSDLDESVVSLSYDVLTILGYKKLNIILFLISSKTELLSNLRFSQFPLNLYKNYLK